MCAPVPDPGRGLAAQAGLRRPLLLLLLPSHAHAVPRHHRAVPDPQVRERNLLGDGAQLLEQLRGLAAGEEAAVGGEGEGRGTLRKAAGWSLREFWNWKRGRGVRRGWVWSRTSRRVTDWAAERRGRLSAGGGAGAGAGGEGAAAALVRLLAGEGVG